MTTITEESLERRVDVDGFRRGEGDCISKAVKTMDPNPDQTTLCVKSGYSSHPLVRTYQIE